MTDVNKQKVIDVSLLIPIYNEEQVIPDLVEALLSIVKKLSMRSEIIFIDDGSRDRSFDLLYEYYQKYPQIIRVIQFSRNFGHQLALTAGLNYAAGNCAIIMDADLQDPPEIISEFIARWQEGYQIVYGVRTKREGETFFKKITAQFFYKLLRMTTTIDIPENVGDFYLLDRKVIDIINGLKERHRFMRGLVAWVGYKKIGVPYVRQPRKAGSTKYGLWKMIKFSFDAITSFSFAPLRFVSWLGAWFSIISFFSILIIIYLKIFTNATIIGWSSTMAVILFIGGIQLLALGIIGEYVARIGDDVKSRPLYNINQILKN